LIARADSNRWPLLLLLGDPAYYERFGFEPAANVGITYAVLGGDDPHFQVRKLARYDSSLRGTFTYCWETPQSNRREV
jgi:putative acetyltransferase